MVTIVIMVGGPPTSSLGGTYCRVAPRTYRRNQPLYTVSRRSCREIMKAAGSMATLRIDRSD